MPSLAKQNQKIGPTLGGHAYIYPFQDVGL